MYMCLSVKLVSEEVCTIPITKPGRACALRVGCCCFFKSRREGTKCTALLFTLSGLLDTMWLNQTRTTGLRRHKNENGVKRTCVPLPRY